jgi:hypothetical protein
VASGSRRVAVNHGRPAVGPRVRQVGLVAVWAGAGAAGSHPAGTAGRPSPTDARCGPWQRQAADLLLFVGPPLLGGVIAARRPDNRYGWLWLAVGLVLAVQAFAMAYAAVAQAAGPDGPPGLAVAAWAFGLAFTAFLSLSPFVFLLFPTGRLPSHRWRLWAWAIIAVGAWMLIATAFNPGTAAEGVANRLGVGGWLGGIFDRVVDPGIGLLALATAVSALSLLPRFRRARAVRAARAGHRQLDVRPSCPRDGSPGCSRSSSCSSPRRPGSPRRAPRRLA